MNKHKNIQALLCITGMLFLSGCTGNSTSGEAPQSEASAPKQEHVAAASTSVKKSPETLEEILADEKEGKYAGDKYDEQAVKRELDNMPAGLSNEEIYTYILDLIGENYKQYKEGFDQVDPQYQVNLKGITAPDIQKQAAKPVYAEVILDASGSMGKSVAGGRKIDLAKQSIERFLQSLPSTTTVGVRVFGHTGSGSAADQASSCAQTELLYGMAPYDAAAIHKVLGPIQPAGWTGIARSLEEARKDLEKQGQGEADHVIYLVSDGFETCGGDPVKVAKEMNQSGIKAVIHVIGFNVNSEEQHQLQKVAEAGGGTYIPVNNATDLQKAFEQQIQDLHKENIEWMIKEGRKLGDEFSKQVDLHSFVAERMGSAVAEESEQMSKIEQYLEEQKKITIAQKVWLSERYGKRYRLVSAYKRKRTLENSKKIDEFYTQEEKLQKQYEQNKQTIEQLKKQ